jgi:hypothetical protein
MNDEGMVEEEKEKSLDYYQAGVTVFQEERKRVKEEGFKVTKQAIPIWNAFLESSGDNISLNNRLKRLMLLLGEGISEFTGMEGVVNPDHAIDKAISERVWPFLSDGERVLIETMVEASNQLTKRKNVTEDGFGISIQVKPEMAFKYFLKKLRMLI